MYMKGVVGDSTEVTAAQFVCKNSDNPRKTDDGTSKASESEETTS
jgi:hypothetical protein